MNLEALRKLPQQVGRALQPIDAVQEKQRGTFPRPEDFDARPADIDCVQPTEIKAIDACRFHTLLPFPIREVCKPKADKSNIFVLGFSMPERYGQAMELRHLRYFRAVAREEHFSRAAQTLRIAQPALSRQIRDLEIELGVELFERFPRGVRLSTAGRVLLAEVENILTQVEQAVTHTRSAAGGHLGAVRVGLSEMIGADEVVSRSLLHFREAEPGVVLELRSIGSILQIGMFRESQLDAGILYDANLEERDAPLLNRAKIGRGTVMLAVHRGHRFASRDSVRMADLADEPMLWPERRLQPGYFDRLMRACVKAGTVPGMAQECTTNSILLSLVAVGMGNGFVTSIQPQSANREVRFVPIADLKLSLDVLMVWRKHDPSPALRRFTEVMKNTALEASSGRFDPE